MNADERFLNGYRWYHMTDEEKLATDTQTRLPGHVVIYELNRLVEEKKLASVVRINVGRLYNARDQWRSIALPLLAACITLVFGLVVAVTQRDEYELAERAAKRHAAEVETRCVCPQIDGTMKTPTGEHVQATCVDGAVTWSTP